MPFDLVCRWLSTCLRSAASSLSKCLSSCHAAASATPHRFPNMHQCWERSFRSFFLNWPACQLWLANTLCTRISTRALEGIFIYKPLAKATAGFMNKPLGCCPGFIITPHWLLAWFVDTPASQWWVPCCLPYMLTQECSASSMFAVFQRPPLHSLDEGASQVPLFTQSLCQVWGSWFLLRCHKFEVFADRS
jgi:hypothetical protein